MWFDPSLAALRSGDRALVLENSLLWIDKGRDGEQADRLRRRRGYSGFGLAHRAEDEPRKHAPMVTAHKPDEPIPVALYDRTLELGSERAEIPQTN